MLRRGANYMNLTFKSKINIMETKDINYKAFVAGNKETPAFDYGYGKTEKSAIAALKRKYSKDKEDLFFWAKELN